MANFAMLAAEVRTWLTGYTSLTALFAIGLVCIFGTACQLTLTISIFQETN